MSPPEFLAHRSVVSVSGADAEAFLNGILTVSTRDLPENELRYGGLLTPQGRVIADMMVSRAEGTFFLDIASLAAPAVAKRLNLMRLRASVEVCERPDLGVAAFEGLADPRDPRAPPRRIGPRSAAVEPARYHGARIAAGLPEQGFDFGVEEVFPADINMDLLGGVDFRKGCFVGQEVVSRMKRRGTARRRTLRVRASAPLDAPCPIHASGFEIGTLTSISGEAGLARVRIDRLAEAQAKHEAITAGGAPVAFDAPGWLTAEAAASETEA